ncbi:YbhB/YbcL family Raf kinase inhibitor-like protein [Dyella caseinilytica]|nr:YbhB/YbcL family Raf kinase inhibitor-like protein [Dyella caseinilytica]
MAFAFAAHATDFIVSSPAFSPNGILKDAQVLHGFGCSGQNISPALMWKGEPQGTRSFAITVYDPDAPTGSGWWHWVVFDIPASVHNVVEGAGTVDSKALPATAIQARTDFGTHAYGGPCPSAGDKAHRYVFTVYALKVAHIEVPTDASAAMIGYVIHGNTLGSTSIQAGYQR